MLINFNYSAVREILSQANIIIFSFALAKKDRRETNN